MPDPEKKGTILTTVSLIVSHRIRKVFTRFYLRHAFQNTVKFSKRVSAIFPSSTASRIAQPDRYRVCNRDIYTDLNSHGIDKALSDLFRLQVPETKLTHTGESITSPPCGK